MEYDGERPLLKGAAGPEPHAVPVPRVVTPGGVGVAFAGGRHGGQVGAHLPIAADIPRGQHHTL